MLFEIFKWFFIAVCGLGALWLIFYFIRDSVDEMNDDRDKSRIVFLTFADIHLTNMVFIIIAVLGIFSVGVYYQLSPDTQKTVIGFFEQIENYFDATHFARSKANGLPPTRE